MEEKNISTLLEEMKDDVSNYVNNKIKLAKLEAYEKASKSGSRIGYGLILSVFIFWGLFFAFLTLALYLASLLGSYVYSFGIMTGVTLLVIIIFLLARKSIKRSMTNNIITELMKDDNNKS